MAFFALMQAQLPDAGFRTLSRVHVRPPTLLPAQQPACFLVDARETYTPGPVKGAPYKLTLSGFVIVYFQAPVPLSSRVGTETNLGATQLNALLLAIRTLFVPDNPVTGKLTLGGLVEHCWLEGDADKDTGIYTQQGAAILPLKILVP